MKSAVKSVPLSLGRPKIRANLCHNMVNGTDPKMADSARNRGVNRRNSRLSKRKQIVYIG